MSEKSSAVVMSQFVPLVSSASGRYGPVSLDLRGRKNQRRFEGSKCTASCHKYPGNEVFVAFRSER